VVLSKPSNVEVEESRSSLAQGVHLPDGSSCETLQESICDVWERFTSLVLGASRYSCRSIPKEPRDQAIRFDFNGKRDVGKVTEGPGEMVHTVFVVPRARMAKAAVL